MQSTATEALASVPEELRSLSQWVVWRSEQNPKPGGKPRKVPYRARDAETRASTLDPASWAPFNAAKASLARDGRLAGVGFVLRADGGYVGVDLDDSLDANGDLSPWAQQVFNQLGGSETYGEVSPSGRGIKLFLKGDLPREEDGSPAKGRNRKGYGPDGAGGVEVYSWGRYFTVTGRRFKHCWLDVGTADEGLHVLYDSLAATEVATPPAGPPIVGGSASPLERCWLYLLKAPEAVSGANGHDKTFRAACETVRFGLAREEAVEIMRRWNDAKCGGEPWTDREIYHKLDSAERQAGKERGCRLRVGPPARTAKPKPANKAKAAPLPGVPDPEREPLVRKDRVGTARRFLAEYYHHPEGRIVLSAMRCLFVWDGSAFGEREPESLRSEVAAWLDLHVVRVKVGDEWEKVPYHPSRSDTQEVVTAIENLCYTDARPPSWLGQQIIGRPDPAKLVICRNGIVDPCSDPIDFIPPTPLMFSTCAANVDYDPQASPPLQWLRFLEQVLPDPQTRATLQEYLGYLLTGETRMQKILLLVGPPRSGKGTIVRVLQAIVGLRNCCSPTLASLGGTFGLMPFLAKRLAIVADARLSGRSDQAAIVERLLTVSGEDAVTVDRKHLPPVTMSLGTRICILTNELPRLNDPSGALASRFIALVFKESFLGREDTTLTGRLVNELPGILLWAIEGWRRLDTRGAFIQPSASQQALEELDDVMSPTKAFLRDWCVVADDVSELAIDLFDGWRAWCQEQGSTHPSTIQRFGVDLRSAVPRLDVTQPVTNDRKRTYVGVALTLAAAESMRVFRANHTPGNRASN